MTKPLPYALILRKVPRNMKGRNNFLYPKEGKVSCPDWSPRPHCGGGLHGYLWGKGSRNTMPSRISEDDHGKWLVIKTIAKNVVGIPQDNEPGREINKWKFKTGTVVLCGTRKAAAEFITSDPNCPKDQTAEKIFKNFFGC